jgi:hypothetical protein
MFSPGGTLVNCDLAKFCDVLISPSVEFKPIKRNALFTNWYCGDMWADLGVEPISVHAQIVRRVPKSY